jgi:hypothetical protein
VAALLALITFAVLAGIVVVAVCALSSRNRQRVEWEQPLPDPERLQLTLPDEDAPVAIR